VYFKYYFLLTSSKYTYFISDKTSLPTQSVKVFIKQLEVTEKEFVLTEYWCIKVTKENKNIIKQYLINALNLPLNCSIFDKGYYSSVKCRNTFGFIEIPKGYIEITFGQFKSHVLNNTDMKTQTLTLGQLKDLYNADDCTEWRNRINPYLKFNNTKKDDFLIEISWEDIEYAKEHYSNPWSNKKQLELLINAGLNLEEVCLYKVGDWVKFKGFIYKITNIDKHPEYKTEDLIYLKNTITCIVCYQKHKDKICLATQEEIDYASIDWDKLKTGSIVKLNTYFPSNKERIFDFNKDESCFIVLYNSQYTITRQAVIKEQDYYVSFIQNGSYYKIELEKFKSCITKVISY
jgi:hypothetical protein